MKAVLISIKPKWCELIASGKKTVEVRKTRPKLKTPFKCYIYRTQGGGVIGEFMCDFIEPWNYSDILEMNSKTGRSILSEISCVPFRELLTYKGELSEIFAWHISSLVIYDKPKELSEFYRECGGIDDTGLCYECDKAVGEECYCAVNYELHLTRPPQSWCYVEELKGKNYGN